MGYYIVVHQGRATVTVNPKIDDNKLQNRDNSVQSTSLRPISLSSLLILFSIISQDLRSGVSGMLRNVTAVFSLGFSTKIYIHF